ncbi:MAG TPA: hypothetical protein VKR24_07970 [Candidatus Limnocylindrales bacterium]|nr:hypothetical protein [Candidatus Limnocylindrales bacterium]
MLNADAASEKRFSLPLPDTHNPVLTRQLVNDTIRATSTTVTTSTSSSATVRFDVGSSIRAA